MSELAPQLGVCGVSGIVEPVDRDTGLGKLRVTQIAAGRGARDIDVRFGLAADGDQAFNPPFGPLEVP